MVFRLWTCLTLVRRFCGFSLLLCFLFILLLFSVIGKKHFLGILGNSSRRKGDASESVLQCDLCPQLLQLRVHVTCLYQVHLLLQLPVGTETEVKGHVSQSPVLTFLCLCTCTAPVCPAAVFSAPLFFQLSAYGR